MLVSDFLELLKKLDLMEEVHDYELVMVAEAGLNEINSFEYNHETKQLLMVGKLIKPE